MSPHPQKRLLCGTDLYVRVAVSSLTSAIPGPWRCLQMDAPLLGVGVYGPFRPERTAMLRREKLYEYVFSRDGEESSVVVRAWSADEAAANVRHLFGVEGVALPGRLVARPLLRPYAWSRSARSRASQVGDPPKAG